MSIARNKQVKYELTRLGASKEVVAAFILVGDAFEALVTLVIDEARAKNEEPEDMDKIIKKLLALLAFKNLSPLTDDPEEWTIISSVLAQSKRNPNAFSTTGGTTYYLLDEKDRLTKTFPVHTSEHVEPPPPPDPVEEPPPPPPVEEEPPPPVEEPPPPPVEDVP